MTEQVRLAKYFTDCNVLSRRAAEEEIRKGLVKVNGEIAEIGQKITPGVDVVEYGGKRILPPGRTGKVYLMLHKPRGFVTTMSDEKGRPTVADLTRSVGARVYPVGRLDMDSEGLLLLTNDGQFANRMMHPSHRVDKVYSVELKGYTEEKLKALHRPIILDGYRISPPDIQLIRADGDRATVHVTIHEGRNRQVRRMCARAGMQVKRLIRIREGILKLGDLPVGKWRYLTDKEIGEM